MSTYIIQLHRFLLNGHHDVRLGLSQPALKHYVMARVACVPSYPRKQVGPPRMLQTGCCLTVSLPMQRRPNTYSPNRRLSNWNNLEHGPRESRKAWKAERSDPVDLRRLGVRLFGLGHSHLFVQVLRSAAGARDTGNEKWNGPYSPIQLLVSFKGSPGFPTHIYCASERLTTYWHFNMHKLDLHLTKQGNPQMSRSCPSNKTEVSHTLRDAHCSFELQCHAAA